MKPADNINNLFENSKITVGSDVDKKILNKAMIALPRQAKADRNIWSIIMHSKITKPIAAAIIIIAVLTGIYQITGSIDGASVAFGEVLKNSYKVQSFHALLNSHGDKSELWCKRGNKLRIEDIEPKDNEVTYQISNGPIMWDVNQTKNRATKSLSRYYKQSQQKGVDVLDYFLRLQDSEDCSGFFAEEPVGQIEENGRTLNLYKTELEQYGDRIMFEAKVDAGTNLLDYMKLDLIDTEGNLQSTELIVLGYDEPVPDEMFVFYPSQSMDITVKEDEQVKQEIAQEADGARLSGRIVWAANGKPVSEASLTIFSGKTIKGKDGKGRREYSKRAETDSDGYWSIDGAPKGIVRIIVRSWELDWPAVPLFTTNIGSAQSPVIMVDGQSEYENLDFEVYKPKDFFAQITINVTDENDAPIEGVSGYLVYDDNNEKHGDIYANPKGKQFTGKDGRFDADNIWPTNKAVKLFLGPYWEFCATYATTRYAQMEGFVIEPKGEYHFAITLPFVRQVLVQVVDTDGKLVEGVSVSAINREGVPIFPFEWSSDFSEVLTDSGVFTDSDGTAEISGLAPGEEFLISVQRLDTVNPDRKKPVTSAIFDAIAPVDLDKPLKQVVFDERPICIEGYFETEDNIDEGRVILMVTGEPGQSTIPYLTGKLDDNGKFELKGVPAGHVRLLVRYRNTENESTSVEGTIDTLPGNRYLLKATEDQIEVIDTKSTISH